LVLTGWRQRSAPAKVRREVPKHTVDQVRVVVDAELVRNGEEQCVRGRDRLVPGEILDELVRLPGVGLAEPRSAAVQISDLVLTVGLAEVCAVEVVDD